MGTLSSSEVGGAGTSSSPEVGGVGTVIARGRRLFHGPIGSAGQRVGAARCVGFEASHRAKQARTQQEVVFRHHRVSSGSPAAPFIFHSCRMQWPCPAGPHACVRVVLMLESARRAEGPATIRSAVSPTQCETSPSARKKFSLRLRTLVPLAARGALCAPRWVRNASRGTLPIASRT